MTSIRFGGVPLANYTVQGKGQETEKKTVTIYEVETKDLAILNKLKRKVDQDLADLEHGGNLKEGSLLPPEGGENSVQEHYENLQCALDDAIQTLGLRKKQDIKDEDDPTVIQLAAVDNKPCGILIGNMPKIKMDHKQWRLTKSSGARENQTELDWLVTWPGNIRGVGRLLTAHFLESCQKIDQAIKAQADVNPIKSLLQPVAEGIGKIAEKLLEHLPNGIAGLPQAETWLRHLVDFCRDFSRRPGIDQVYLMSDTAQTSKGERFYQEFGFTRQTDETVPWMTADSPRPVTYLHSRKKFEEDDFPEYPMTLSMETGRAIARETMEEFQRKEVDSPESVNLGKKLEL